MRASCLGLRSVGITTSMARTHAALLAPVWLHYPFEDSAPRFQSSPEPLLISGRASRAVRSAAPSSLPIRINPLGVQLPECLSTPTSSDQCCTKPTLHLHVCTFFFYVSAVDRPSIPFLTFAQSRVQQSECRRPGWSARAPIAGRPHAHLFLGVAQSK